MFLGVEVYFCLCFLIGVLTSGRCGGTITTVEFPQLNAEGEFLRAVPSGPGFFSTFPRPTYQPRIAVARRVPKNNPKP